MVCCGFIVCTTPCQLYVLISYITQTVDYTHWFYQFTVVLVDANSCINAYSRNSTELLCQSTGFITCLSPVLIAIFCIKAFIYAANYREFQQGVRCLIAELSKRLNQHQTQLDTSIEMVDTIGADLPGTMGADAPVDGRLMGAVHP